MASEQPEKPDVCMCGWHLPELKIDVFMPREIAQRLYFLRVEIICPLCKRVHSETRNKI